MRLPSSFLQLLLLSLLPRNCHGFSTVPHRRGGGGRAPHQPDTIEPDESSTDTSTPDSSTIQQWLSTVHRPSEPSEARLLVLQVTDVYTLENFASFQTLLEETRAKAKGAQVISMLTGDFLSPYLLSSVDRGYGMMRALNQIPLDILTWGNHEADIDHATVCRHVRNFQGTWLNSNMQTHETMEYQKDCEVIQVTSPDGTNKRQVGLVAVLSDDPALYAQFKAPGAFGGATIEDPWETLRHYQETLDDCDLILPLQHLYVPDDHKTCQEFDFPVVLSGHDHHRVNQVVNGTRLLKPGMNAEYATLLELSWPDTTTNAKPSIRAQFLKCSDWPPNLQAQENNERAYNALKPLANTQLATVPDSFQPLSSNGSRDSVCTMGKFICSLLRTSLNVSRQQRQHKVDAVLLMGGNIRGNADYFNEHFFSLKALEAEIKSDEVIAVVPMPGWLLAEGVEATHNGEPIPGWMQYDEGVLEELQTVTDSNGETKQVWRVTHVAGEPLELDKIYRVYTKISDLTNGQSPPWTDFYLEHPHWLPPKGAYVNIHAELMAHFARNLWLKLWNAIGDDCRERKVCNPEERLEALDQTGDGIVTVEEIQVALRDRLGLSIDKREQSLAEFVHSFADQTGDGTIRLMDLEVFCAELGAEVDEDVMEEMVLVDEISPLAEEEEEENGDDDVNSGNTDTVISGSKASTKASVVK